SFGRTNRNEPAASLSVVFSVRHPESATARRLELPGGARGDGQRVWVGCTDGLDRNWHLSFWIAGWGLGHLAVDLEVGQASIQPLRQLPVRASERVHDRRDQNGPDDEGGG